MESGILLYVSVSGDMIGGQEHELTIVRSAVFCVLATAMCCAAHRSSGDPYPLHGVVVSMSSRSYRRNIPVYTDPYGKTRGGGSGRGRRRYVYTIRTKALDYDVEGKPLEVGTEVMFRVEKVRAYVRIGDKTVRYAVVGERCAPQSQYRGCALLEPGTRKASH